MSSALPSLDSMRSLIWERWPASLAKISQTLGYTAADGRYLAPFPFVLTLLPVIMFLFGLQGGAFNFYIGQPLYISALPILCMIVIIACASGGLGLMIASGYALGYLLFFDHTFFHDGDRAARHLAENWGHIYLAMGMVFLNLFLLVIMPMMARALSAMACLQISGDKERLPNSVHLLLQFLTDVMLIALFMMIWVQVSIAVAFAFYQWQENSYGEWDVIPFLQAELWHLHPLIWAGVAGVILRYVLEIFCAFKQEQEPYELPKPYAFWSKIPLTVKTLGGVLFMSLLLSGYLEEIRHVVYLVGTLLVLYLARDWIEVVLHKWFALLEYIPAAWRLPLVFALCYPVAEWAVHWSEETLYLLTIQAVVVAACFCLPVLFMFVSKNEPHKGNTPPPTPFWARGLMKLFKKIGLSVSARRKAMKATPHLLAAFILLTSFNAFAHHCVDGCPSCFMNEFKAAMAAVGITMMAGAFVIGTYGTGAVVLAGAGGIGLRGAATIGGRGLAGWGARAGAAGVGVGLGNELGDNVSLNSKSRESKPKDAPSGTIPIDKAKKKYGLDTEDVHDIKEGVEAKPKHWTGITPDGDVITGDKDGNAQNWGPYEDYIQGKR